MTSQPENTAKHGRDTPAHDARALFLNNSNGILSTISGKLDGYPFGSVVPYCLDYTGVPIVLISDIAEHTRNIKKCSHASIIAFDGLDGDAQSRGRVTVMGDLLPANPGETEAMERYYRYFPESRGYHKTHEFGFYRLHVKKVRFIGGFGAIHWIDTTSFQLPNPFTADQELAIIRHMNNDHVDAMRKYCDKYGRIIPAAAEPVMAGIDASGFHLKVADQLYRFGFSRPVDSTLMARQELVRMVRE